MPRCKPHNVKLSKQYPSCWDCSARHVPCSATHDEGQYPCKACIKRNKQDSCVPHGRDPRWIPGVTGVETNKGKRASRAFSRKDKGGGSGASRARKQAKKKRRQRKQKARKAAAQLEKQSAETHSRRPQRTSRPRPGGYMDRRHTSKSLSSDEDVGSASFDSASVDFDRATSGDNESTFSTKSPCAAKDNPQYSPDSQHRDDEETIIKQEVQQDIKMSQRRRRRRRFRGLIQAVQGSRSEDENTVIIEFDNTENGRELAEDVRKLEELLNGAKVRYEKGKRAWSAEH
ncbi:putative zn(2)-C6 fungal-type DNA-binding domain-containing protein [Septoria linicola]|nr:putative zn(2)-C6 fungal-type DNA-binding domain-containing protein [Septoria linicola]